MSKETVDFKDLVGKGTFPYLHKDGKHLFLPWWTHPEGGDITVGKNGRFTRGNPNTSTPVGPRRISPMKEDSIYPYLMDLGFVGVPEAIKEYGELRVLADEAVEDGDRYLSGLCRLWAKVFLGQNNSGLEEVPYLPQNYEEEDHRRLMGSLRNALALEKLQDNSLNWNLSPKEALAIRHIIGEPIGEIAHSLGVMEGTVESWERESGAMKKSEAVCYMIAACQVEAGLTPFFLIEDFATTLKAHEVREGLEVLNMDTQELSSLLDIHESSAAHFVADNERNMVDANAIVFQYLVKLHR